MMMATMMMECFFNKHGDLDIAFFGIAFFFAGFGLFLVTVGVTVSTTGV